MKMDGFKFKKRSLAHNYLRPQNYYNRLFTFYFFASFFITLTLVGFVILRIDFFIMKFGIILLLLMLISALVEFFNRGEYMSPLEVYDVEIFYNELYNDLNFKPELIPNYFSKYTFSLKKNFNKIFKKRKKYLLSSIRKNLGVYEITIINNQKMLEFFFIKFLIGKSMHKIYLKKISGKFRIINIK